MKNILRVIVLIGMMIWLAIALQSCISTPQERSIRSAAVQHSLTCYRVAELVYMDRNGYKCTELFSEKGRNEVINIYNKLSDMNSEELLELVNTIANKPK